ncbi:hypothetical protein [Phaffia rhodozyma]|uniref:Uncharacterized protein n=1 Tax=Phaffia rhodozyma TaxID=264483 RepID=A0A0F7SIH5_PHARH|nr:hypothetical protein [Phaffia rhodozyma]
MSPEGFLVTKRWRKRQPTLSLPAHAASLHSTPTQHRSTSSSLLARSLSPSCQVQTGTAADPSDSIPCRKESGSCLLTLDVSCQLSIPFAGHTLQPTTVHDFLESLHSTPKKPKKGKKRKEHMPRQNGSQHVSTLPPLIFEDGICTPVLKFRPRPHPPSIRFKARHRPALSAPIAAIPTSSSEDKLSFDLSNFKQLSSWKEKIDVKSSSIQESRKKELQLPDCQKKPKGTSRPSNKRRATIQKPTSKTLKQLELMGSDDRFPPYEPKSDPQQWLSHSSNIDHIKVKPVSAFTTIHQATRFLSPLAELPVECSPVESEPITSSPPRLDPPTRLVSVADSITVNQDLRILNLRNISMDENEVELRTPVQSSLRPRRLDLQELSTRPSIDPPDGWEKEPDRQLRLLSSTPHCASASNTVTFPRLYSRPRKRPSFSAEEILERLLPVASQVSNSSWLEKETAAHVFAGPRAFYGTGLH